MLHLGLEDDAHAVQVARARPLLLRGAVAPARDQQGGHGRLGRQDQLLGLNKRNEKYTVFRITQTLSLFTEQSVTD